MKKVKPRLTLTDRAAANKGHIENREALRCVSLGYCAVVVPFFQI